nr:phage tail tape measure protein [uncultured Mediterranean phage uvMED]
MAAYDVDIALKLEGLQQLKKLQDSLRATEKEANRLAKNYGGSLERAIQLEEKLFNLAKDRLHLQTQFNNKTEEGNRKARQATADFIRRQRILKQGLTQHASPIGPDVALRSHKEAQQRAVEMEVSLRKAADAVNMKYDLRLRQTKRLGAERRKAMQIVDREIDFEKRLNKVLEKRTNITKNQNKQRSTKPVSSQQRFGSAVSAGAFPLLFGGGPGMALGGALGGAVSGSTFGPMSIALQVLGGGFDQLAAKAASLGAALNPATADIDAIVESLGLVGHPTQDVITSLEELAGKQVALEAATSQLALVVGDEGVEALTAFGDASTQFANALTKITTQVLAQIARLTGPIVAEIAKSMEIGALLNEAKASTDTRQIELQGKLAAVPVKAGSQGMPSMERVRIETEMVKLQKEIRAEEEGKLKAQLEKTRAGSAEHVIAKNNLAISKLEGDLTNTRIFSLEKANIMQEAIKKKRKENADITLIDTERETALQNLVSKRNDQIEAASKRSAAASDKQQRAEQRAEERQQRAIERRVKAVDREIERTENAFNKASQQLDSITQKHEDKMAFEREYSRLIMEGSTPAAAKQAVELKKQLLELDRGYEKLLQTVNAQIVKAEASLQDLKNQKGVTNEYIEQQKALDKLKQDRDDLEGKKGKAGGAIEEALAPKTFLDKLDDEAERLQGVLNALVDPANQVIAAANAIGDAFSESFKGVIDGSMTAQQALANLFQRTADHFLDMTAQIIAAAIKMQAIQFVTQIIGSMAGAAASGGGAAAPASKAGAAANLPGPKGDFGLGAGPSFGSVSDFKPATILPAKKFAEGGFVSSPTSALIGEGGEPEYVIPASKMRESMSRYSRGSRGGGVIPSDGGSSASGEGGVAVAAPIDVRYTVERINSVDYVTADQFQSGMQSAAAQGAQRGEQNTLKRLQMSGGTRKRLGL